MQKTVLQCTCVGSLHTNINSKASHVWLQRDKPAASLSWRAARSIGESILQKTVLQCTCAGSLHTCMKSVIAVRQLCCKPVLQRSALHWVCINCCFMCGTRKAATARLSCDHLVRLHIFVALLEQLSVPLQPKAWSQKPTSNPQTTLAGCEPQRAPSRAVLQANWQQDWPKSDLCKQLDQAC